VFSWLFANLGRERVARRNFYFVIASEAKQSRF